MSEIRLAELKDAKTTAKRLATGGLSAPAAADKAVMLDKCAAALAKAGVAALSPVRVLFVPGRIEVLGKHTDYAGGRSLVVAVEQGFCLLAAPRAEARDLLTTMVRPPMAAWMTSRRARRSMSVAWAGRAVMIRGVMTGRLPRS